MGKMKSSYDKTKEEVHHVLSKITWPVLLVAIIAYSIPVLKIFSIIVLVLALQKIARGEKKLLEKKINFKAVFTNISPGIVVYLLFALIYIIASIGFFLGHTDEISELYDGVSKTDRILGKVNSEGLGSLMAKQNSLAYQSVIVLMYGLVSMLVINFSRFFYLKDLFEFKKIKKLFSQKMLRYTLASLILVAGLRWLMLLISKILTSVSAWFLDFLSIGLLYTHDFIMAAFLYLILVLPMTVLAMGFRN